MGLICSSILWMHQPWTLRIPSRECVTATNQERLMKNTSTEYNAWRVIFIFFFGFFVFILMFLQILIPIKFYYSMLMCHNCIMPKSKHNLMHIYLNFCSLTNEYTFFCLMIMVLEYFCFYFLLLWIEPYFDTPNIIWHYIVDDVST